MKPVFNKTKLENGMRLVTESVPGRASVHLGLHLLWGSRNEPEHMAGAAHLIEHMVFKGTHIRSAYDLVKEIEAVGGEIGASTGKEMTSYTVQCLAKDLELGVDLLADLCLNADFKEEEFEKERDVVLSEIAMSNENFEELVFDYAFEDAFGKNPLARPIIGSIESVKSIKCAELFDLYKSAYKPERMLLSVSGEIDHEEVLASLNKYFSFNNSDLEDKSKANSTGCFVGKTRFEEKPSEQAHVLVSFSAPSYRAEDRLKAYIANTALGGGMTSILYQKIREDMGLAYSVYSYLQCFLLEGVQSIYVGTRPNKSLDVLGVVVDEVKRLVEKGLSQSELDLYKEQLKGEILMNADDLEDRMNSIAINELVFGAYKEPQTLVDEIMSIGLDDMRQYFKTYFNSEPSVVVLGSKQEI